MLPIYFCCKKIIVESLKFHFENSILSVESYPMKTWKINYEGCTLTLALQTFQTDMGMNIDKKRT
jgi:hypothetical protein